MRITKISDKNPAYSRLSLHRDQSCAKLSSDIGDFSTIEEIETVLKGRDEGFKLSMIAKTLRRRIPLKSLSEKLEALVGCALKEKDYQWMGERPDLEIIRRCLKARFADGAELGFDLAELLHESIEEDNTITHTVLAPYVNKAEKNTGSEICRYRGLERLRDHLEVFFTELLKPKFPAWGSPKPNKEDIRSCLLPRFAHDVDSLGFDLAELIHQFISTHDFSIMRPYTNWVRRYTEQKKSHLAKSLYSNAIQANPSAAAPQQTSRKRALATWAAALLSKKRNAKMLLDLSACESALKLSKLVTDLQIVYVEHKEHYQLASLLKSQFQEHCRELLEQHAAQGTAEDDETRQYRLEFTKYLERHFPIKGIAKLARRRKKSAPAKQAAFDQSLFLGEKKIHETIKKQLCNATLLYIIQQGKQRHYAYGAYSSTDLIRIRTEEGFASHFINACAFAGQNLRNALAPDLAEDILLLRTFASALTDIDALGTRAEVWLRLRAFFELGDEVNNQMLDDIGSDKADFESMARGLRHAIAGVRNEVVHYRKKLLDIKHHNEIVDIAADPHSPLSRLMAHEIAELPMLYREQLRSSCVLEYYFPGEVAKLLPHYSLTPRILPFMPSFHRVFTQGRTLQEKSGNAYKTLFYFPHDPSAEQGCLARRNALRLIYEGGFAERVFADSCLFAKAVNSVLGGNKRQADANKMKKHQYAFAQIEAYQLGVETPKEYLQRIHSQMILDEQAKRKQGKLAHDETGYFQQFLDYLFMKAFDLYLAMPELGYGFLLRDPRDRHEGKRPKERAESIENELDEMTLPLGKMALSPTNLAHLSFWCFAKMLNPQMISELSNQILKFQLLYEQQNPHAPILKDLPIYREILSLCRLSAERFPTIAGEKEHQALSIYVEKSLLKHEPYKQADEETPVLFARVKLARRYATQRVLGEVLKKNKVCGAELKRLEAVQDAIPEMMRERQELHADLCKKKKGEMPKAMLARYKELQEAIDEYNWLRNRVELVHVLALHHLLIDILGRLAGFVRLMERHLRFCHDELIHHAYHEYKEKDWSGGIPKLAAPEWASFLADVFKLPSDWKDLRNYVAHFNYIGQKEYSLLALIYQVRQLMAHDRKLQNAVTTSMIDLLDRHGVRVDFCSAALHAGSLKIISCEPKMVQHLKQVDVAHVHRGFAQMVRDLLEYDPTTTP